MKTSQYILSVNLKPVSATGKKKIFCSFPNKA